MSVREVSEPQRKNALFKLLYCSRSWNEGRDGRDLNIAMELAREKAEAVFAAFSTIDQTHIGELINRSHRVEVDLTYIPNIAKFIASVETIKRQILQSVENEDPSFGSLKTELNNLQRAITEFIKIKLKLTEFSEARLAHKPTRKEIQVVKQIAESDFVEMLGEEKINEASILYFYDSTYNHRLFVTKDLFFNLSKRFSCGNRVYFKGKKLFKESFFLKWSFMLLTYDNEGRVIAFCGKHKRGKYKVEVFLLEETTEGFQPQSLGRFALQEDQVGPVAPRTINYAASALAKLSSEDGAGGAGGAAE